jgi:hypothetical protein
MPYYRCPACSVTSYSAASYSTAPACPSCSAPLAVDSRRVLGLGANNLGGTRVAHPQATGATPQSAT